MLGSGDKESLVEQGAGFKVQMSEIADRMVTASDSAGVRLGGIL